MTSEGSSAARRRPGSGSGGPATAKEEAEEAGAAPAPPPPQRQWRPSGSAGPCPAPRRCWGSPGATGSMLLNFTGTTVSGRPPPRPTSSTGRVPAPRGAEGAPGAAPPWEGPWGADTTRQGARLEGAAGPGPGEEVGSVSPPPPPSARSQRRGRVRCPVRGSRGGCAPRPGAREQRGADSACPSSCNPGHGARRSEPVPGGRYLLPSVQPGLGELPCQVRHPPPLTAALAAPAQGTGRDISLSVKPCYCGYPRCAGVSSKGGMGYSRGSALLCDLCMD